MPGEEHVASLDPFGLVDLESDRVGAFFDSLDEDGWTKETRCDGWRVRELLSHVAGVETYHLACLDDAIGALFEEAGKHGVTDMDSFNDWVVRARADLPCDEVLGEWRAKNAEVRRRLRELGADATMASSVGPYNVGLMAFHIASEYATHADDMDAAIAEGERSGRLAWRVQVSKFAIAEAEKPVTVEQTDGGELVRLGNIEATLSHEDFVEAVTARLPSDHAIDPELRDALRALA